MIKRDCETAIRSLVHRWAREEGIETGPTAEPSFMAFLGWLRDGYPALLGFRTSTSVEYDVEMWFDDEMQQNWRR